LVKELKSIKFPGLEDVYKIPAGGSGGTGQDGKDGITPTIGANGNWYLGDEDTGKPSRGATGPQGATGPAGPDGAPGKDGAPGADGTTFTPSVSAAGDLSWTNDGGKANPAPVNLKGPQGPAGKAPVKGTDYFTEADKQEIAKDAAALIDLSGKQNKITAAGILKGDGAGGVTAATPGEDYLTEAPVTSVNGATGAAKSAFYVTVTQGADDSVTVDKTAAEVYAAYAAGYAVYAIAKFSNINIPYTLPLEAAVNISGNVMLGFGAAGSNYPTQKPKYLCVVYNGNDWLAWNGTLTRSEDIPTIPTKLPNPWALNIKIGNTTTSYDGSVEKTVEIPKGVPSVTSADNGKFLRVVDGAWAAVEIANANGGSF
jgi:hypothetical protein